MMSQGLGTSATGAIAREERCYVLYAHVADGVTPDQGYAMRDALNDAETNGWWFLNPGTFIVVFTSSSSGAKRAESCVAALARLAAEHPSWPAVSVGLAEGPIFGAFTSAGVLESMPFGEVVSAAMRRMRTNL